MGILLVEILVGFKIMDRNQFLFILVTGFLTLLTIKVLDYYKINDPFVTFAVLAFVWFVVSNAWKNVKV